VSALAAELAQPAELGLLAVLQGLTEFLPVSSSGHLVLAQAWLGFEGSAVRLDVALHLGTLGAVLVGYRRDLAAIARDALRADLREVFMLALGTLPAVVVGLLFKDALHAAFGSTRAAAFGLCATAAILIAGERARRRRRAQGAAALEVAGTERTGDGNVGRERVGPLDAIAIGTAQALAIFPGISRSGSTIACGLMRGLHPRAAARFSFLLAIPAIAGAAVLELPDAGANDGIGTGALVAAALLAGVVGYAALRGLLAFLGRGAFTWFAVYVAVLGAAVLAFG